MEQNQKQNHDVEMRRKQQELEDRVAYNLVQAERDREQQIRKVTFHFMWTVFWCKLICWVNTSDWLIFKVLIFIQTLQQNLAHAEQVKVDASLKNEIENKQRMDDIHRESTALKVCAIFDLVNLLFENNLSWLNLFRTRCQFSGRFPKFVT